MKKDFEREYMKNQDDPERWHDYFCWAEWEDEKNRRFLSCGMIKDAISAPFSLKCDDTKRVMC